MNAPVLRLLDQAHARYVGVREVNATERGRPPLARGCAHRAHPRPRHGVAPSPDVDAINEAAEARIVGARQIAEDDVAEACVQALRAVAEERVGQLLDVLLDRNQPFVVRRRLARTLSACGSQRAVDGLLLGLEDLRFEVRFQCGRSLLAVAQRNPAVRIEQDRVFAFVRKEVAVNSDVWKSRHLLDEPGDDDKSFLDELLRDRASQSLAHVFTLLALVLPTEPLRISFRGLHTNDQMLRGTALEYLESVLPADIRQLLFPFVEDSRPPARTTRSREDVLSDLLHSHQSIQLNLEDIKTRLASRSVKT